MISCKYNNSRHYNRQYSASNNKYLCQTCSVVALMICVCVFRTFQSQYSCRRRRKKTGTMKRKKLPEITRRKSKSWKRKERSLERSESNAVCSWGFLNYVSDTSGRLSDWFPALRVSQIVCVQLVTKFAACLRKYLSAGIDTFTDYCVACQSSADMESCIFGSVEVNDPVHENLIHFN